MAVIDDVLSKRQASERGGDFFAPLAYARLRSNGFEDLIQAATDALGGLFVILGDESIDPGEIALCVARDP